MSVYLHELIIDTPKTLDFENAPIDAFEALYKLIVASTIGMNKIEPDLDNFIFVRIPIS
jgi:hypothetical protein